MIQVVNSKSIIVVKKLILNLNDKIYKPWARRIPDLKFIFVRIVPTNYNIMTWKKQQIFMAMSMRKSIIASSFFRNM